MTISEFKPQTLFKIAKTRCKRLIQVEMMENVRNAKNQKRMARIERTKNATNEAKRRRTEGEQNRENGPSTSGCSRPKGLNYYTSNNQI